MKGEATEVEICGIIINLNDFVKVEYTTGTRMKGGTIEGRVTELWGPESGHLQARVDSGWCFHDHDRILKHERL